MRDPSFCQRKIIKFGFLSVLLLLPAASSQVCSADGTCENAARVPAKVIETISIEYGEPQVVLNHDSDITRTHIQQTQRYIMRHFSWKQTCLNRHHLCSFWAAIGECHKNELYMHKHCTASCQKCVVPDLEKPKVMESSQNDPQKGTTDNKTTPSSSSSSIITENSESAILVATSFGESQYVPTVNADPVVQNIAKSTTYMGRVLTEDHYAPVREECKNRHQKCSLWASEGGLEQNHCSFLFFLVSDFQ